MKKIFITSCLLLVLIGSMLAQTSLITVSGKAERSLPPQKVLVTYTINATEKSYSLAVTQMSQRVDALTEALRKEGFRKEDIKTSNFSIGKYQAYDEGKPQGERFTASQTLGVRFDHTTEKLLSVLNHTTSGEAAPSVTIDFRLSDAQIKNVQKTLMALAVKDAQTKAQILSDASGYTIVGVKAMTYDVGVSSVGYPSSYATALSSSRVSNFEAEDLVLRESVVIVFEIKK